MKRKEFRIIATNGSWTKEFLFFVQGAKGDIYYGEPDHLGLRTSVHASGVAHQRTSGFLIPLGRGQRLSQFKGMRQLFSLNIGKLVFVNPHFGKQFNGKKVDGVVLIDVRKFRSDIGIMAFLLEPVHADELNKLMKILHEPQFTIFTETTPWLVIAVHSPEMVVDRSINASSQEPS